MCNHARQTINDDDEYVCLDCGQVLEPQYQVPPVELFEPIPEQLPSVNLSPIYEFLSDVMDRHHIAPMVRSDAMYWIRHKLFNFLSLKPISENIMNRSVVGFALWVSLRIHGASRSIYEIESMVDGCLDRLAMIQSNYPQYDGDEKPSHFAPRFALDLNLGRRRRIQLAIRADSLCEKLNWSADKVMAVVLTHDFPNDIVAISNRSGFSSAVLRKGVCEWQIFCDNERLPPRIGGGGDGY